MAIGNSGLLNKIKGVTSVLALTDAEKASLAEYVLPAHILVADSDNILYLTDGTSSIKNLDPIVAASKAYAVDSQTVHTTGDETIAGAKSFTSDVEFTSVTNSYITGLFAE